MDAKAAHEHLWVNFDIDGKKIPDHFRCLGCEITIHNNEIIRVFRQYRSVQEACNAVANCGVTSGPSQA